MDPFSRINNNFIKFTESQSVKNRSRPQPLSNSLKTLISTEYYTQSGSEAIYDRKRTLDIPKNYDHMSQIFLKFTLSTGLAAATIETFLATKIMKSIRILSAQGTELQRITPRYSQARIDQTYMTPNYSWYQLCVENQGEFADGDVTCILPLFTFFSENPNTFLPTKKLEQLKLELITNDNSAAMGINQNLTLLTTEIYVTYHNVNNSSRNDDIVYMNKPGIPKQLYGSYNMYEEETTTCLTGSTSKIVLLKCPHAVFSLNLALVDANSNRKQIKNVRMKIGNSEFLNLDYRMNFQMYGDQSGFLENGSFSYFVDKEKNRTVPSGLLTFSKEFYPCYLTVEFDALATDYTLYIFNEVHTLYNISDNGEVGLNTALQPQIGIEGQDRQAYDLAQGQYFQH